MCGSLLSSLPQTNILRFLHFFITYDGVANDAKLHLRRSFQTHFMMSQINVINANISETTTSSYVKTLLIDDQ